MVFFEQDFKQYMVETQLPFKQGFFHIYLGKVSSEDPFRDFLKFLDKKFGISFTKEMEESRSPLRIEKQNYGYVDPLIAHTRFMDDYN